MVTLVWGALPDIPADPLPTGTQQWRGVRETNLSLWLIREDDDKRPSEALAERFGIGRDHVRVLHTLRDWGERSRNAASLANFVLREMTPESVDTFVPLLFDQVEKVIASPGCLGNSLAAEKDFAHHLLGISYWESEAAFDSYAQWASTHSWKDIVDPITVSVPLRLFARRIH